MVLRTDYIKCIFMQLCAVMGVFVCVGGVVWEREREERECVMFISFRRKSWSGRKLKNKLTLVIDVTATDIKQEISPEHSEVSTQ